MRRTRRPQSANGALRGLPWLASVALIALCSCASDTRHVGRIPLGDRRPLSERATGEAVQGPRSGERRDASADARIERITRRPQEMDADRTVTGVYTTKEFHLPRCEKLDGVPAADRVTFVSPYDGMDARYHPCRVCNADHAPE